MTDQRPPAIWTEKTVVARLREALVDVPGAKLWSGQGGDHWFAPLEWSLVGRQQFQFGDFRLETPGLVAVVEIDTAGGVTNLMKYWPYLRSRPEHLDGRRFRLAHLFALGSANDYVSHLHLWDFLAERMRDDLAGLDWDARRFVGRDVGQAVAQVAAYIHDGLTTR